MAKAEVQPLQFVLQWKYTRNGKTWDENSVVNRETFDPPLSDSELNSAVSSGCFVVAADPERMVAVEVAQVLLGGLARDFPVRRLLVEAGFREIAQVRAASDETLLEINGIGKHTLKQIRALQDTSLA